jgi:hypothetical protein
MSDYTDKYVTEGHFDLCQMINDDFIVAIKKTWNDKHYTSCLKLLVSFIDTMAFVDTGESTSSNFKQWLSSYVDLAPVGITADELWEHRNAILHMTTYDSRKVTAGAVARLVPYISVSAPAVSDGSFKYYSLHSLIMTVMNGLGRYVTTMDGDDSMKQRFCSNYKKTVSDSHFTTL